MPADVLAPVGDRTSASTTIITLKHTHDSVKVSSTINYFEHIFCDQILFKMVRWDLEWDTATLLRNNIPHRDHSGYVLSQWETMLQCNIIISHWLTQFNPYHRQTSDHRQEDMWNHYFFFFSLTVPWGASLKQACNLLHWVSGVHLAIVKQPRA